MPTNMLYPDVFVSYASRNRERVVEIAKHLEAAGVTVWRDQNQILGGENYGPRIVHGIKNCKVLLLVCTVASMRSKNVKQEIQLAWKYDRPYLPILAEPMDAFPEQIEYWLEGCQWVSMLNRSTDQWLPQVLKALACRGVPISNRDREATEITHSKGNGLVGLGELRALARFTDQIWPVPAVSARQGAARLRDLGAPQDDVQHGFRVGSQVCLVVESDRPGHLLLLDEGPSGKVYCLCPSAFAPNTHITAGRTYLPQEGSRYPSFVVTGRPGREHLLAVVTDEPLDLEWMPGEPAREPARVLNANDIDALLARLRSLEGERWTALSTYFAVVE